MNSCCLLQPFPLTCILQWTKNWKCLQESQSNLEEQKTAPRVEGQFLSFCKNAGGTESADELPVRFAFPMMPTISLASN